MRHKIAGNKLNRHTAHRKATVRDLAKATLIQQRICTTKAKAKEARKMVDRLITLGKSGTLANKRRAFAILCDHKLVSNLFNTIATRFAKRPGGYTRIILANNRRGDNAQLAYLELTERSGAIVSQPQSAASDISKEVRATKKIEPKTVEQEPKVKSEKKTKPVKKASTKSEKTEDTQDKKKSDNKSGGLGKIFKRKSSEK